MREADRRFVVARVQGVVNAVLRRVIGANDPEFEDLAQSSLEQVLAATKTGKFRGDCPLHRWAASIARNVAVDALRARSRDRRLFDHDETEEVVSATPATEDGPEHLADMHRQLQQIDDALVELGPAKAKVVYLHDVLGYELAEVAVMLGTSVAAAQSRLVRGRRQIVSACAANPPHPIRSR